MAKTKRKTAAEEVPAHLRHHRVRTTNQIPEESGERDAIQDTAEPAPEPKPAPGSLKSALVQMIEETRKPDRRAIYDGLVEAIEGKPKKLGQHEAGMPVAFDVLCGELKGLGLNVTLEKKRVESGKVAVAGSVQHGDPEWVEEIAGRWRDPISLDDLDDYNQEYRDWLSSCDVREIVIKLAPASKSGHPPEMDDVEQAQRERQLQNAAQVFAALNEDDLWGVDPALARVVQSAKQWQEHKAGRGAFSLESFLSGTDDVAIATYGAEHLSELFTKYAGEELQSRDSMKAFARRVNGIAKKEGLRVHHERLGVGSLAVGGKPLSGVFTIHVKGSGRSMGGGVRKIPAGLSTVPAGEPAVVNP